MTLTAIGFIKFKRKTKPSQNIMKIIANTNPLFKISYLMPTMMVAPSSTVTIFDGGSKLYSFIMGLRK